MLKKNNINELTYYYNKNIEDKINILQVGYLWYIINSLKNLIDKPNYNNYFNLRLCIEYSYLVFRIDEYIFFKYYKWYIPCIDFIKDEGINKTNINILKSIYEYDYEVFKVLLYLYWDLEYYLSNLYNVKNSLIVGFSDRTFIRIKFNNEYISNIEFFEKIKYKNLNMVWINFKLIYNLLLKYDIFNKINDLNEINKDDIDLSIYKL